MGNKGSVWDILIQVGRVHRKRVFTPGRKDHNGPSLSNLIPLTLLLTDGTLTVKYHRYLLVQRGLLPEDGKDVFPGV